jgi:hypothetical protein
VKDSARQEAHLGVTTLAGVSADGVGQGNDLAQGRKKSATEYVAAVVAPRYCGVPGSQLAELAGGT